MASKGKQTREKIDKKKKAAQESESDSFEMSDLEPEAKVKSSKTEGAAQKRSAKADEKQQKKTDTSLKS